MKYITSKITALESPFLSEKDSGLGNVLWQISSVYGISKALGIECTFPRVKIFTELLKNRYNYNHGTTILRNVPILDKDIEFETIRENDNDVKNYSKLLNSELVKYIKESNNNIMIDGYISNHNFFFHVQDDIRNLFSCDEITLNIIKSRYDYLFDPSINTVAVHFRDFYNNDPRLKINSDYYLRSINYIKENVENPLFLIFTNNKECVDVSLFKDVNFRFLQNEVDYIDLYCMSMCKNCIMSVSTFSFWASFLNNNPNKIILYEKTFENGFYKLFTSI